MRGVKLYPSGILKIALAFVTRNFSVNAKASNVVGRLCHCVEISDFWVSVSIVDRVYPLLPFAAVFSVSPLSSYSMPDIMDIIMYMMQKKPEIKPTTTSIILCLAPCLR